MANNKIPIYQYSVEGKFIKPYNSIAEAANTLDVDESTIRKRLDTGKTALGFLWSKFNKKEDVEILPRAKILVLDIETAPLLAYTWGLWKQNISIDAIVTDWFMLSWAAKFLGESDVYSNVLTSEEAIEQDDKRIVTNLWTLLDEADIIVAHHGDQFDMPRIRSRFLIHDLAPPSPYKQIDTKKIAAKEFGFSSNKLDALAKLLGHEAKHKTSLELWINCMKGKSRALQEMEHYNVQDIYVLENVYFSLRPYIKGHANLDLYVDSKNPVCPSCGEDSLKLVSGKYYYTQVVRYPIYKCENCNSICRAKKGNKYKNKKSVSPIPR